MLALLVAPIALVLAGRGLGGLAGAAAAAARQDAFTTSSAAAALGLSGLVYALLVMIRFSPVGPFLAGLGYLSVGVWALADPAGFDAALRRDLVSLVDLDAELLAAAEVAPLLAVPLLITVFSGRRWQGRPGRRARHERSGTTLDTRSPNEPALVMEPVTSPPTHTGPSPIAPLSSRPWPVDPRPVAPLSSRPWPVDRRPVDLRPVDRRPVDRRPADPPDPRPVDLRPVDPPPAAPADPPPADPPPADPPPADPPPADPPPQPGPGERR
jgi:hypothetical protein